MKNRSRCDELGLCQGLDPELCPDCDAFECEVACNAPRDLPYYPFAPGIIHGSEQPGAYMDDDGPWLPLSLWETLKLLAVMLVLGTLAGYLVERFA